MLEQNFSAIFDESLIEQNVWRHILGITLSLICGAILGFEGFKKSKKLMTYCVVCAGSCLFCIISKADWLDSGDAGKADQSRIAAQVVTGVGFLGAGFIVKGTGDQISGLKRAGLLWTCAAVGMGFAYQYYIITIYLIFVLQVIKILSALRVFDICDSEQDADDVLLRLRKKKKNTLLNGDRETTEDLSD